MDKEKETKITTTETKKPAFLQKEKFEDESTEFCANDIKMSQLKLLQKYKEGRGKPGEFIDSISFANYGSEVDIVVLKHQKLWVKFKNDLTLDKKSTDGKYWDDSAPLTEEEKWKNLSHKFYVLITVDLQPFPVMVNFMNTSCKSGAELLNYIIRFSKANNEAIFSRVYTLSSKEIEDGTYNYQVMKIQPKSYVQDEKTYKFAKEVYEKIKNITFIEPEDNSEVVESDTPEMD